MRVRTFEEIKSRIIKSFERDYPGEKIVESAFSIYVLDAYCRLLETQELYRHMVRTQNDL